MRKQVDYEAIANNFEKLEQISQKRVIAVLKNNGYNCGLLAVANSVISRGCQLIMVTDVSEAIAIADSFPAVKVLIATVLDEREFKLIADYQFELMVDSSAYINTYYDYLQAHNWHLKVNVGMNRFGFDKRDEVTRIINNYRGQITGLYAHMPLEDEDQAIYNQQVEAFIGYYNLFRVKPNYIHLENSYTMQKADPRLNICNYTRLGILLYGYGNEQLKPAIKLSGKVVKIRSYHTADTFSYGLNNIAKPGQRIATIDIGYGDGIIDSRSQLKFYIKNRGYHQIGNQSMSHTYLIVDEAVEVGDAVEVYGENVSISDHAKAIGYPCSKLMSYLN